MSTSRIKEKLSKIVSSQLPEFIQTDYSLFVSFIEAYYKFLEQDQGAYELIQNSRSYQDIDRTTDAFVKYFLAQYASLIPANVLADKKLLIKKIRDLYESKGSELSFKLLFRILFNTDVTVKYPYELVLRASDGRWEQKNSLRIETATGNRGDILNRFLTYTINGVKFETPIIEVKNLTSTLTEVFLDKNKLAPSYTVGDTINVFGANNTLVFSGIIKPTATTYTIPKAGSGFKVGQIYTVSSGSALNTIIKITKVNGTGGITELKIINFGYGIIGPFSVDLDPTKTVSSTSDIISSSTQGFRSSGFVAVGDPAGPDRYFLSDYVSETYAFEGTIYNFSNNTFVPASATGPTKPANIATITFGTGSLGRYPGSFSTNNGFLSEPDVRLQDDKLYQPFAYQTNTEIDISKFFSIVKLLVHPAGQNLFNNRIINNNFDVSSNVNVTFRSNIFGEYQSSFEAYDILSYQLQTIFADSQATTDLVRVDSNKILDGVSVTLSDVPSLSTFTQDYFAEIYVSEDYVGTYTVIF